MKISYWVGIKRVLNNLKTKGILEKFSCQLLSEFETHSKYEENITPSLTAIKVEFMLPIHHDGFIYLLDSNFLSDYLNIRMFENEKRRNRSAENTAITSNQYRTIRDKYIYVPDTTDF